MELKPGSRWRSAVCDAELVVVRAPAEDVRLECGGHPVLPVEGRPTPGIAIDSRFAEGTPVGKRFADDGCGIEVLVTKSGQGSLAVNGVPLSLKQAKPLPSSD